MLFCIWSDRTICVQPTGKFSSAPDGQSEPGTTLSGFTSIENLRISDLRTVRFITVDGKTIQVCDFVPTSVLEDSLRTIHFITLSVHGLCAADPSVVRSSTALLPSTHHHRFCDTYSS